MAAPPSHRKAAEAIRSISTAHGQLGRTEPEGDPPAAVTIAPRNTASPTDAGGAPPPGAYALA